MICAIYSIITDISKLIIPSNYFEIDVIRDGHISTLILSQTTPIEKIMQPYFTQTVLSIHYQLDCDLSKFHMHNCHNIYKGNI